MAVPINLADAWRRSGLLLEGVRARVEVGRFAVEIKDDRPNGSFVSTRYEKKGSQWVKFGEVTA